MRTASGGNQAKKLRETFKVRINSELKFYDKDVLYCIDAKGNDAIKDVFYFEHISYTAEGETQDGSKKSKAGRRSKDCKSSR